MNEEELEGWVKSFPQKMKMALSQVMPVAYHINSGVGVSGMEPVDKFNLRFRHFSLNDNSEAFLDAFNKFIEGVVRNKQENKDSGF